VNACHFIVNVALGIAAEILSQFYIGEDWSEKPASFLKKKVERPNELKFANYIKKKIEV